MKSLIFRLECKLLGPVIFGLAAHLWHGQIVVKHEVADKDTTERFFHLRRDQRLEAIPKGPSRALVVVLAIGKCGLISQKQRSLRLSQEMATL